MIRVHFTDFFDVPERVLKEYGAFNISLVADIPLFVDPFLLFNSEGERYQELHNEIIRYLRFLRDRAVAGSLSPGLLQAWFTFPEVKENWLGYSKVGSAGRGLGKKFAHALSTNLASIFASFGDERVTKGSHLEKVCLIESGVGRDNISDFTTNLIQGFLLEYTQDFTRMHVASALQGRFGVRKARFDYNTCTWRTGAYVLPKYKSGYVLLTPEDLLTKEEAWISRAGMYRDFDRVVEALPNAQLRAELNQYLATALPSYRDHTREEESQAITDAIRKYPAFIEYYIRSKEERGDEAVSLSGQRVREAATMFVARAAAFVQELEGGTGFYQTAGNTRAETLTRIGYLKDVVENKGGHRFFWVDGQPIRREEDLHVFFRLAWCGTPSDVSAEVNDGRGPADFKISRGAADKTIVEFKLASNKSLKRNLEKQVEIYRKASSAKSGIKVIVYFSDEEYWRVTTILKDLGLSGHDDVVLIDAGAEKPSGSRARVR